MSLRDKTVSGILWAFLQNIGAKSISFVVTIILARLLAPESFGLIGLLMIFIQLSQILVQAGFNQALIQKQDADEEDYSSVFWINLVVSVIIYAMLYVGAPLVAKFYEQPILINLLRTLSVVFVINAFSYVQRARLTKQMRFKTLTIIHIPSTIIGGIISVVLALMDYGVWSLVALQLITQFTFAIQIWYWAKWKPLIKININRVMGLFSFGGRLMLSGVINTISQNAYVVVIGKFFPLSSVGYYQNSLKFVKTPASTISSAVAKVTFPLFSSIQNDNKLLRKGLKRINQQVLFVVCPIFIFAAILAEPLFGFVLGQKWLPAVPYFQWLCVVGIFYPLSVYNLNIINAKGKSDIYLNLTIVKKLVFILTLIAAIPFGIWLLLAVQAFNIIFAYFLNSYYLGKYINYPLLQQLEDLLPIMIISIAAGLSVFIIDFIKVTSYLSKLLIGGGGGIIIYFLLAKIFKLSALYEYEKIIKKIM